MDRPSASPATILFFRQFERCACHCAFYIMLFVQMQQDGAGITTILVLSLISYVFALLAAPALNRLIPLKMRSSIAGLVMFLAIMLVWLPAVIEFFGISLNSFYIQCFFIIPLAFYHYLSAVQLMNVVDSKAAALLPYIISGALGIAIGVFFPNINVWIPLGSILVINQILNSFKWAGEDETWG